MTSEEVKDLIKDLHFPILLFAENQDKINPVILYKDNQTYYQYTFDPESGTLTKNLLDPSQTNFFVAGKNIFNRTEEAEKILIITCFPNKPIFSADQLEKNDSSTNKLSTFARLFRVLRSEKQEIGYIYIYAIISGIIGLSLPLGVQSIIGFISSGEISTSVVVLISLIILGILIVGGLQVMQLWLVEHIQQRIFTKTAFEFAFRIPKIKIESVLKYYPPELMNRFFDIITLQKGLAKILIEFSAALLQIILGLVLLSLYHSSFIFFGLFLVIILTLILRITGPKGLKTSLKESKYKYMLANWLEEIARSISTFKLAGYSNLPMEKTDYYVSNYLNARKSHFKILVIQYLSFIGFKTLITGGLLILGCVLLIEKQINIGQFVASEIIIILIMNAVEKIIIQLDTVYDVLTSIEKIGTVTDLPIEVPSGTNIHRSVSEKGLALKIKDLTYKYPAEPGYILKGINLDVQASERICLSGYSSSGKTTLVNIILGFLTSYEGVITFNNISLRNINKNSLISMIGDNVSQEDLFDGTLVENITLGRQNIYLEDILWAIECVGLDHFVQSLPDGLHTHLVNGKLGISESVARKIILARSIANKPKLLILEDFMLGLEKQTKLRLLDVLSGEEHKWTLIVISNDQEIMRLCNRTVIMKEGSIVFNGNYEEIKKDLHFNDLI
ncbi:MAG: ATP-binding cassette domain-containing protein [Cytophagaceae bacterium]|nr:ATP-binding cassette domain-containing protein [Cytophagaceae bacterium]